jgi:hypothetical protein
MVIKADNFGGGKGINMFELAHEGHENEMTKEWVGLVWFGFWSGMCRARVDVSSQFS